LILVTGESTSISRHVRMSGLDGVITKPVNIKNIGGSLREYIEHMRLNPPAVVTQCNVDDCSTYQVMPKNQTPNPEPLNLEPYGLDTLDPKPLNLEPP